MSTRTNTKWIVAGTMALVLLAGGLAVGSNMGFKGNFVVDVATDDASCSVGTPCASPAGNSRISLPFNNPYPDSDALCAQLGLPANTVVEQFDAGGGSFSAPPGICGLANLALDSHRGVFLTPPAATAADINVIVVGSHSPTDTVVLSSGGGNPAPFGDNWISLPYHTTVTDAAGLCADIGLDASQVLEWNDDGGGGLGAFTSPAFLCDLGTGTNFTIEVGRSYLVQLDAGAPASVNWIPSHF